MTVVVSKEHAPLKIPADKGARRAKYCGFHLGQVCLSSQGISRQLVVSCLSPETGQDTLVRSGYYWWKAPYSCKCLTGVGMKATCANSLVVHGAIRRMFRKGVTKETAEAPIHIAIIGVKRGLR